MRGAPIRVGRTPSIVDASVLLRLLAVVLVASVTTAVALALPAPTPASGAVSSVPIGFYAGGIDPSGVEADGAATSTTPVYGEDYADCDTWSDMTTSAADWLWDAWNGSGLTLLLGVCPWAGDANTSDGQTITASQNLANGAAGDFNAHWVSLGQQLVANGESDAVLRFGWEFNGSWEAWSPTDATDAENFAASFRQFVTAMRSVPGQHFQFDWNPAEGWTSYPLADAYPGNAYVDEVGLDVYDNTWDSSCMNSTFDNTSTPAESNCVWNDDIVNGSNGLAWLTSFAASEGKPMSIPEWGLDIRSDGHGLGDDPTFIDNMASWLSTHDVAFSSYFDTDESDGSHCLQDATFVNSLAAFRADFGTATTTTTQPTTTTTQPTTTTTTQPTTTTTTQPTGPPRPVPSPVTGDGWTFNGDAQVQGSQLVLNAQQPDSEGSAVFDRPIRSDDLHVAFDLTFSDGTGADGATVAFLDPGSAQDSLGTDGGGLGFGGLAGHAATFDSYLNGSTNHQVGVASGSGASWGSLDMVDAVTAGVPSLHDASTTVLVSYHSGRLAIAVNGRRRLAVSVTLPPRVVLAFTGASGYAADAHSLSDVSIWH